MVEHDQLEIDCPNCGHKAQRWFKKLGDQSFVVDAAWLKTVHEVMDRSNPAPHVQEFLKHPTRANYHTWMKNEGLRPFEPGEERRKPATVDHGRIVDGMMQRHQMRGAIEI